MLDPKILDRRVYQPNYSTNLIPQTNVNFSGWSVPGAVLGLKGGKGVNGLRDAASVTEDSSVTTTHNVALTVVVSASALPYRVSLFAKRLTGNRNIELNVFNGAFSGGVTGAKIDLDTGSLIGAPGAFGGVFTSVGTQVKDFGDGWKQFILSFTNDTNGTLNILALLCNGTSDTYTGDGLSSLLLWGAELRQP